ncbi:RHS repeat domain-containing protein [Shewanella baltica]|uniref:RHS repeat domain-containing protein n=1 Tax=Shewanella baltica TaxID=62322 RepID=UPI00217EF8DE|nr:RHS repeat-associated core domain-containing protein [Shewanella baltica]
MTNSKGLMMKLWTQFILLLVALISIPSYAATVRYQHTDMLGSVVSESDASGNIISRSHYEPFGKRIGGDKEGIGYTGHLQDKDLGLTYMQARYYDPLIGRFYSNDPIGFRDVHSFNRYAYANNNPYRYTDPTGMCSEENSGSKIACAAEDYLKEKLEPVIEEAMKEAGVDVKSPGERDPDGEYEHQAGDNTTTEEISAILIVGAKAKMGKGKGPRPKTKGANSRDNKQVNDAAKTAGIKDRAGFGKYIENEKKMSGRGGSDNYSYEELKELADEFKHNGGS